MKKLPAVRRMTDADMAPVVSLLARAFDEMRYGAAGLSFDSSSVSFKAGVVYGLSILRTIIKYLLFKWGFVRYKQFN